MSGFVHHIDPIMGSFLGVHLWWYGLSYTLGFLNAHLFIVRRRRDLGLSLRSVYDLSLLLAAGVLLGGRFVEVMFYERPFYAAHPGLIPAYWLGGMATHGLLIGGLAGIWTFCRTHGRPFLVITDALAIPAAFILGVGRLGNFIDGQIVGSVTTVPWAVKFPDAEGFRHPVVLYDGIKNLLLIPILMRIARSRPPSGVMTGSFLLLYAGLRIAIDIFREYPTTLLGLATGQSFNIVLSVVGMLLLLIRARTRAGGAAGDVVQDAHRMEERPIHEGLLWRRLLLAVILAFSLVLPSDWTQDVPARYGNRHDGLRHSALYPQIDTTPPPTVSP